MATQLKQWRIKKNFTQQQMGEKAQIDQQRISILERGLQPSDDELVKLAGIGIPVDEYYPRQKSKAA